VSLGDSLPKGLALGLSNAELERRGLAGAVTGGKGTSAPRRTTVDLIEVGEVGECVLVAEGNVDEAVVSKGAHGGDAGRLLATTLGAGADEQTGVLAPVGAVGPLLARVVKESLPLRGEVAVTGGDTEEDGVVLLEGGGVGQEGDVGGLAGSAHLGENLLGEGLRDLVQGGFAARLADALKLGFGLGEGGLAACLNGSVVSYLGTMTMAMVMTLALATVRES
jgi:hypothetical protein